MEEPGDKAVDPAAVDVLDSSVENLQGVARPPAVNVAASSTVSNSEGAWGFPPGRAASTRCIFTVGFGWWPFLIRLVSWFPGRRKKNRPVRAFPTDEGTLWKARPASGRAEAWGRLISQSSEVGFVWFGCLFNSWNSGNDMPHML